MFEQFNRKISYNKILNFFIDLVYLACLAVFILFRGQLNSSLWKHTYESIDNISYHLGQIYENNLCWIIGSIALYKIWKIQMKTVIKVLLLGMVIVGKMIQLATEDYVILLAILMLIGAIGMSAKKIIMTVLLINVPCLLITIVASQIGVLENIIQAGRNREYLGYLWTTTPVMLFTYSVFLYLVLKKGNINLILYAILSGINIWFFLKTNTRFAFLILEMLLTLFYYLRIKYRRDLTRGKVISKELIVAIPWLFFLIIIISSIIYRDNNELFRFINEILSNRLKQCNYSISLYPILPFGQKITWVTTKDATIDNPATYVDTAYLQILLKYGYVYTIFSLVLSSFFLYRTSKEKMVSLQIVYTTILIFGLTEQQCYWYEYNALLFVVFADWTSIKNANIESAIQSNRKTVRVKCLRSL